MKKWETMLLLKEIDVLICIGKEAKYMYQKAKEKNEECLLILSSNSKKLLNNLESNF